jgi:hypothetical protein
VKRTELPERLLRPEPRARATVLEARDNELEGKRQVKRINVTVREISLSIASEDVRNAEITIPYEIGRGLVLAGQRLLPQALREIRAPESRSTLGGKAGLVGLSAAVLMLAAAYGFIRTRDPEPAAPPVFLDVPEGRSDPDPAPRQAASAAPKAPIQARQEAKAVTVSEPRKPTKPRRLGVDFWSLAPVQDAVGRALTSGETETWQLGSLGGFVTATPDKERACWSLLLWARGWAQGETLRQRRCAAGIDVDQAQAPAEGHEVSLEVPPS